MGGIDRRGTGPGGDLSEAKESTNAAPAAILWDLKVSKSLRRSQIEAMLACEGGRRNSTFLDLDSLDSTRFSEVAESKNLPASSNTSSTGYI